MPKLIYKIETNIIIFIHIIGVEDHLEKAFILIVNHDRVWSKFNKVHNVHYVLAHHLLKKMIFLWD